MKNKRLMSIFLVVIMVISTVLSARSISYAAAMEGAGTEESPYLIRTVDDLYRIPDNPAAHYKLMNNLDLQNIERESMPEFNGILDGNNFTIKNLIVNGETSVGFFSIIQDAVIKNICFESAKISSNDGDAGVITGQSQYSRMINCMVKNSNLKDIDYNAGALCGDSMSTKIIDCSVIDTEIIGQCNVGALVGYLYEGEMLHSYSTGGKVINVNDYFSGVLNCGGLIGVSEYSGVYQSYSSTDVTVSNPERAVWYGGLIGKARFTDVKQSYALNSVMGGGKVGGIIGYAGEVTSIEDCYYIGELSATSTITSHIDYGSVGGITPSETKIKNCYAVYSVPVSRILQPISDADSKISNSYFNREIINMNKPADQARTTAQMYQKSNYEGWDFENIWCIDEGKDYPRLRFESILPTPIKTLKVVLEPNEELQLSVDEDLAENSNMTWTSSDETVAAVDNIGVVKALKKGNTIITVKSIDGSYIMEIKVLVVDNAKEYRLAIDLSVGKSCRLTIDDAEDITLATWTSNDPTIATVTDRGRVTAVAEGLSLIQAKDANGEEIGQVYVRVR